jgi:hypothetical protein
MKKILFVNWLTRHKVQGSTVPEFACRKKHVLTINPGGRSLRRQKVENYNVDSTFGQPLLEISDSISSTKQFGRTEVVQ